MTHLEKENILQYTGVLSFLKINELLDHYRKEVQDLALHQTIQKRLYAILVEALENAYRHRINEDAEDAVNRVDCVVNCYADYSEVVVGNLVLSETAQVLKAKIERINSLDHEGVNLLYREAIAQAKISPKGGAGLGLIEIARNSRFQINYQMKDDRDGMVYFKFVITISNNPQKQNI